MALYSTFFLTTPANLPIGFPGWRLPLDRPVRREVRDRFTGETSLVETREPEGPEGSHEVAEREYQVTEIDGSYQDFLQGRLPPFVRACPHWAAKGLTDLELDPLIQAAGIPGAVEHAIHSPPGSGAVVFQLPVECPAKLVSLDQRALATQWAAAMSTPEHTHTVTGVRLEDDWTASEALELLRPLAALAQKATAGQRMYLLIEA